MFFTKAYSKMPDRSEIGQLRVKTFLTTKHKIWQLQTKLVLVVHAFKSRRNQSLMLMIMTLDFLNPLSSGWWCACAADSSGFVFPGIDQGMADFVQYETRATSWFFLCRATSWFFLWDPAPPLDFFCLDGEKRRRSILPLIAVTDWALSSGSIAWST